jgi:hypothetical protein
MDNVELLKKIETTLRKPESDRDYLASQLMVLAGVIAHSKECESGMVRGALGGMAYTIDRLREIWKEPNAPEGKSLEELQDLFAQVELARFARNQKDLDATREKYRKENVLINIHQLKVGDLDEPVFIFSSRQNQTTIDGEKLMAGEILDAACTMVPSFHTVFRHLNNPNKKR